MWFVKIIKQNMNGGDYENKLQNLTNKIGVTITLILLQLILTNTWVKPTLIKWLNILKYNFIGYFIGILFIQYADTHTYTHIV